MHQKTELPVLQLQNIEKTYGSHTVLEIDEWVIGEGIFWIQGENGAGKSTLFRVLAGMLPFSGEIVLDDKYDIRRHPVDYRLRVNLGEADPLYPAFLTPLDLVRFTAETRKSPPGQPGIIMERLGIDSYQNQPVGACSSGMVKKLSLALAFLGDPRLIILDEPLTTIDSEAREVLFALVKEYRQHGASFLISSHQLFESGAIELTETFRLINRTLIPVS